MLNVITINKSDSGNIIKKIKNLFSKKTPTIKEISENGITMVHINYHQIGKRIPWRKILKCIKNKEFPILCNSNIQIPTKFKVNRFSSNLFMQRLCENGALISIKRADVNPLCINISLYDPDALHIDMVQFLLRFTAKLKVITNKTDVYTNETQRLMEEYGASILVSDKIDWISPCHVLLAPDKIKKDLKVSSNTIIFTASKPTVPLNGQIYYGYKVLMPEKYKKFILNGISVEYILSGLYENCKAYDLGAVVPQYFISENMMISFSEMVNKILNTVKVT